MSNSCSEEEIKINDIEIQAYRNKMNQQLDEQRKYFDDAYAAKVNTPTPIHLVRKANKQKLDSLRDGSSTTITFDSADIRVTRTLKGQIGFFEEDIIAYMQIDESNFPKHERDEFREDWDGYMSDVDERLLVLEPAVYYYATRSKTENSKKFIKWVFTEVLPCVRMSGMYVEGKVEGKTFSQLLRDIDMSQKLLHDRVERNEKQRSDEMAEFTKRNNVDLVATHIAHTLSERQTEYMAFYTNQVTKLDSLERTVKASQDDVKAIARVLQEALMPDNRRVLVETEAIETVVVHKPTEDQVKLYNVLHYQASTCVEKRIVTSVFRSKFESFNGPLLDKDKEKSLLDWVAKSGPEKLESFLKSCAEFVELYGMKALTLDSAKQIDKDYTPGEYGRLKYTEIKSILEKT